MSNELIVQKELNRVTAKQDRFEQYLILHDFIYGHDIVLEFMVFKVTGEYADGTSSFELRDSSSCDATENLSEAQVFLSGSIKWDGCSNWHFDDQDNCMLHFCGVKDASSIGRLMERMYDITAAEMPSFDRDLAGMPPQINV